MIDITQDLHSLTDFKRNSSDLMKLMRKTGRPLVLTVKGKAEAVVLDADSYSVAAEYLDTVAALREGLRQIDRSEAIPMDEVFDEVERGLAGHVQR